MKANTKIWEVHCDKYFTLYALESVKRFFVYIKQCNPQDFVIL